MCFRTDCVIGLSKRYNAYALHVYTLHLQIGSPETQKRPLPDLRLASTSAISQIPRFMAAIMPFLMQPVDFFEKKIV